MHRGNVHNQKNTTNVSRTRVTHFLYSTGKSVEYSLFFIFKRIFDQMCVALYFNIEFERAFGKKITEFWFVWYYTKKNL